ncbi:MAG: hypothetical protein WDM80_14980 [Limisphaerales bacterium]
MLRVYLQSSPPQLRKLVVGKLLPQKARRAVISVDGGIKMKSSSVGNDIMVAVRKDYVAPTGLKFHFGFDSTNMPRLRRWGRMPTPNTIWDGTTRYFPLVRTRFSISDNSTNELTANSRDELSDKRTLKGQTIHLQKAFKPRFHFRHGVGLSCGAFST